MGFAQAPVNVSPTIKFMRWSFLICGIVYGINKKAVYEVLEKNLRKLREEAIHRRHTAESENTKKVYKETLIFFGEIVGLEFPPDWEPPQ